MNAQPAALPPHSAAKLPPPILSRPAAARRGRVA